MSSARQRHNSARPHSPKHRRSRFLRQASLGIERLEPRLPLAAELLADLNLGPNPQGADPRDLVEVGGVTFFTARDPEHGRELWKSDGTVDGTVLVKDIFPGSYGSDIDSLTNVGGTLFFTAFEEQSGYGLWKSDGTDAGTILVKSVSREAYYGGSYPAGSLTSVGGTLYFIASDEVNGTELWKSDGTPEGTVPVKDITAGPGDSPLDELANVDGTLYFARTDGNVGQLWRSDGTDEGTVLVKEISGGSYYYGSTPQHLTSVGGILYFTADDEASGRELWKSDGTEAGTIPVKDIASGTASSYPNSLTIVDGTIYFVANDGDSGSELWKSDGTEDGTVLVKDIRPAGSSGSYPQYLTSHGGLLYFNASDGISGRELWTSDGTEAGTAMVKDIRDGSYSSRPESMTSVGGTLFFTAFDEQSGNALWKSDGTEAGTVLVKEIGSHSNYYGSYPAHSLTSIGGALYFVGNDGQTGNELWKSDGTADGTVVVKDIVSGNAGSFPRELVDAGGTLYFVANETSDSIELWKSDGTNAGTVLVKQISIDGYYGYSSGTSLTSAGGRVFFLVNDGIHGEELWTSDGTEAGTQLVRDIDEGAYGSYPRYLTNVGGTLYFSAHDGNSGRELWKSDGTAEGTVLVSDLVSGPNSSSPHELINVDGTLYFGVSEDPTIQLWKSDGSEAGTVLVKSIPAESYYGYSRLGSLTPVAGTLYFTANGVGTGYELWKSDGTEAGTVLVKDIHAGPYSSHPSGLASADGTLYFLADDGTSGDELWKSDGTEAGTVLVKDIHAGEMSSYPHSLMYFEGALYFSADDGTSGFELWTSDGTEPGTVLVRDIRNGPGSSHLHSLTSFGGSLYFTANDGLSGWEIWKTDGTSGGTVLAADIVPGGGSSFPDDFIVLADSLIFTASDAPHGQELWHVTADATNEPPTAEDVAASTDEDVAVDVFLDATDPNGDLLGYTIITPPAHGTLSGAAPNLIYTPDENFSGDDSFTYQASDGSLDSNVGTVEITIAPVNDAPVAASQSLSTAEDTGLNVTLAATDEENDPLTLALVDGPLHGTLTGTVPNLVYTPDQDFHGTDSFTFRASDGALDSNLATISITVTPVNDPPTATGTALIVQGVTQQLLSFPGTFADPDGETLQVTWDFGDGNTLSTDSLDAQASLAGHRYSSAGAFNVTLTVADALGSVTVPIAAVTISNTAIISGELYVGGTAGDDTFSVTPGLAGAYSIVRNGAKMGTFKNVVVKLFGGDGADKVIANGTNAANLIVVQPNLMSSLGRTLQTSDVETREVNAQGGNDTIKVIGGTVIVRGGLGKNTLDTSAVSGVTVNLATKTVSEIGAFTGISTFVGSSDSTLVGANLPGAWLLTAADRGSIGATRFVGFGSLVGGSAADVFKVSQGVSFAGAINGGDGTDKLDYVAYTQGVQVNLAASTATGVAGVASVENVTGGKGRDVLIGSAANNVLTGGPGNDIVLGGAGADTLVSGGGFDLLIGGSGEDLLRGTGQRVSRRTIPGKEILAGGPTSYSDESTGATDTAALLAILAEWTRTDQTYAQRVDHLSGNVSGGLNGAHVLNATTVLADSEVDQLFGSSGTDWFLASPFDMLPDKAAIEVLTATD